MPSAVPFNLAVGFTIRRLRRNSGMTLERLAEQASVDVGYLSRLERGMHSPTLERAVRIARALGVGLDALVGPPTPDRSVLRGRQLARKLDRLAGGSGAVGDAVGSLLDALVRVQERGPSYRARKVRTRLRRD